MPLFVAMSQYRSSSENILIPQNPWRGWLAGCTEHDPAAALSRNSATETYEQDLATLVGLGYAESASPAAPLQNLARISGTTAAIDERPAMQAEIDRLTVSHTRLFLRSLSLSLHHIHFFSRGDCS